VRALPVAILFASVALLAGCGSSGQKSNGVEDKTANEIVHAAATAAKSASSVHISGTIGAGGPTTIDLTLARNEGGKGELKTNGMSFQIISTGGKVYFKTDAAALQKLTGAGIAGQLLEGRWIVAPSSLGRVSSFNALTDLTKLFNTLTSSLGVLRKGDTTKVNGQPAIAVTSTRKGGGGTLYVATTGQPYPLQLTGSKGNAGTISFDRWDEPATISPPANPVDFSRLTG
jgi:hypothetical protein